MLENLGIAVHSVELERRDPGDWAVILGAGPIGILAAQTLVAWSVNTVITDLSDARLVFARQHTGGHGDRYQAGRTGAKSVRPYPRQGR